MSRPPTKALTISQMRLMQAIQGYIDEKGFSPSSRELQHKLEFKSQTAIHQALIALENKGYIAHKMLNERRVARSVEITGLGKRMMVESTKAEPGNP